MKICLILPLVPLIFAPAVEPLHLTGKLTNAEVINPKKQKFFNYVASLFRNGEQYCSAFVLSPFHLLTAAQCIKIFIVSQDENLFEEYYALIASLQIEKTRVPYYFKQVEIHPQYQMDGEKPKCDIGIITLMKTIEEHGNFIPIPVEMSTLLKHKKMIGYAPGFKTLCVNNTAHITLKQMKVTVHNIKHRFVTSYEEKWGQSSEYVIVIPVNDYGYLEDGDVGAPLFTPASYRVRGILVHVPNRRYMPSLYVTVLHHMQWIEDVKADRQYGNLTRRVSTRSSKYEPYLPPDLLPELHV